MTKWMNIRSSRTIRRNPHQQDNSGPSLAKKRKKPLQGRTRERQLMISLSPHQLYLSFSFKFNSKLFNFTVLIAIVGLRDLIKTLRYLKYVGIFNHILNFIILNRNHILVLLFIDVLYSLVCLHPLFKLFIGLFKFVSECVTGLSETDSDSVSKENGGVIPISLNDCVGVSGVS